MLDVASCRRRVRTEPLGPGRWQDLGLGVNRRPEQKLHVGSTRFRPSERVLEGRPGEVKQLGRRLCDAFATAIETKNTKPTSWPMNLP